MVRTALRRADPEEAARRKLETQCHQVAEELSGIAAEALAANLDTDQELATFAPRVIAALCGNHTVFICLDERPGRYDGYSRAGRTGYHGLLRRVRNSLVWGPKMFESFRD